jgi:hypothetical protein
MLALLNTLVTNSGTSVTSSSSTFAAPATGTAATTAAISVVAGQKLLVTIYTSCQNSNAARGCYMSFDATSTGAAGITQTASDNAMAGGSAELANSQYGQSGTFVFTATGTGTVTFTGKYRRIANTATFNSNSITVQVFG